jgi:hypothetical protein
VHNLLIPALRGAITRRHVVAVTHNPDLAIVCNADHLIAATYTDGSFRYTSTRPTVMGPAGTLRVGKIWLVAR